LNPWKRKPKEKVKRKGLPGQRTRITSGLTLLIVLFFIALWFLIISPPVPPVPINASTSAPMVTPTLPVVFGINGGTPVGTLVVVPALQPLQIKALCTDPKQYRTLWQVLNPNPYAVKFTATTRSLATWATQPGTVPAMSGDTPGTLQLQSFYEAPGVIMTLAVEGSDSAPFSPNNPQPCPSTGLNN